MSYYGMRQRSVCLTIDGLVLLRRMFGPQGGVATPQVRKHPGSMVSRCASHTKALGLKHALDAEPFMTRHYVPTLQTAGNITSHSTKKHEFLGEVAELLGFSSRPAALVKPVTTRWETWNQVAMALAETPKHYACQQMALRRAGQGGDQDDYVLDAGAADATADGCATQLSTREYIAVTTALLDYLPDLKRAGKQLEAQNLDHDTSRRIIGDMLAMTGRLADDYKNNALRGSEWRKFMAEVEALGVPIRKTPGRTETWIDNLLQRLADAIHSNHEAMLEDSEVLAAMCRLFDPTGAPQPSDSHEAVQAHYEPMLEKIVIQYCAVDGDPADHQPDLDEDALRNEFDSFVRVYLSVSRAYNAKELPGYRTAEKKRVDKHNAEVDAHNAKAHNSSTRRRKIVTPLPSRMPLIDVLSNALLDDVIGLHQYPAVEFLVTSYMVAILSQAPTEVAFSKLKRFVTKFRTLLTQEHTDMLMYVQMNGPNSFLGRATNYSKADMIDAAYRCYCNLSARKVTAKPRPIGDYDLTYKFGYGFDATAAGVAIIEAAKAEDLANREKRTPVDPAKLSDHVIGSGAPIITDHVWVECCGRRGEPPKRRACWVDRGERTPQINDELAITGFGGKVWYEARIFDMHPPKRGKRSEPVYQCQCFYTADTTKVPTPLAPSCYGPARVTVGDVRINGKTVSDSYSAGWVFLVPEAEVEQQAAAAAAPSE